MLLLRLTPGTPLARRRREQLQWGHGDGAVEEAPPAGLSVPETALQWGHGDGAVEERAGPAIS